MIASPISDLEVPGGVITTHCVSSVIKPGATKAGDPLKFVKIQSAELSKKAVEQIRLAEEVKVTKEKIKEVEEEWQSNLLNWKSKRRQSKETGPESNGRLSDAADENGDGPTRKIKTFSEILNEKAKSGQRLGYNLSRYVEGEEENVDALFSEIPQSTSEPSSTITTNSACSQDEEQRGASCSPTATVEYDNHRHHDEHLPDANHEMGTSTKTATDEVTQATRNDNEPPVNDEDNCSDDNSHHNNEQQRNVWNYLLQQQDQPNRIHSDPRPSLSDYDEEDELFADDSHEYDDDLAQQQMINFKEKLTAFEKLAKNPEPEPAKPPAPRPKTNGVTGKRPMPPPLSQRTAAVGEEAKDLPPRPIKPQVDLSKQTAKDMDRLSDQFSRGHISDRQPMPTSHSQGHLSYTTAANQPQHRQSPPPLHSYYQQQYHHDQLYANQHMMDPYQQQQAHMPSQFTQPPPLTSSSAYDQQQYFLLDEDFRSRPPVSSTGAAPIQEPLYVNNQPEQLHYMQQQQQHNQSFTTTNGHGASNHPHHPQHLQQPHPYNGGGGGSPPFNHQLYYPKPFKQLPAQQGPQKPKHVSAGQLPQSYPIYKPVPQPPRPYDPATGAPVYPPQPAISKSQSTGNAGTGYNQNHWLIQEAEHRRQVAQAPVKTSRPPPAVQPNTTGNLQKMSSTSMLPPHPLLPGEQIYENMSQAQLAAQQKQGMLSVSGRKKCSSCGDELGRGCAAMVIESLSLYYHINCFRCSVCHIQLGNGTCGTDVRVRNHKLHCNNCYSNDEAGLKFSRV